MKTDELVQRFLDQELSADERIQFIVALGRDQMLRERVLEMERLVLDASKLARPTVPDGFVAQVMARTAARGTPKAARRAKPTAGRGVVWSRDCGRPGRCSGIWRVPPRSPASC